jgi:hypothetical protein
MTIARLFNHTITIQIISEDTASAGSYGHTPKSWVTHEADVPCTIQPFMGAANWRNEKEENIEGSNVDPYVVYMAYRSDLVEDADHEQEFKYRFKDAKDKKTGTTIHPGVFDIQTIRNGGGRGRHLEIATNRIKETEEA